MIRIPLTAEPRRYRVSWALSTGQDLSLRLAWSDRAEAWYLDVVVAETGEVLAAGVRVTPGADVLPWKPIAALDRFVFLGPDPYPREALGDTVQLYYVEDADLEGA